MAGAARAARAPRVTPEAPDQAEDRAALAKASAVTVPQRHGRKPTHRDERRSKLTPEVIAQMTALVRAGLSKDRAADGVGVAHSTLYRWLQLADTGVGGTASAQARVLRDSLKRAEAEFVSQQLAVVQAAADSGKAWQASAWMLERRFPEEYGRRDGMAVGLHSDVQVRVVVETDWHGRGHRVVDTTGGPVQESGGR